MSLRGPKLKIIAAVLAVIAIAVGVYTFFFQARGFEKTTATIIDIERITGSGDDDDTFRPTVEYTVNGKTYTGVLDESRGSYRVGKVISVRYDPNDPSVVHGDGTIGICFMAVGVVILAAVIITSIRGKKSQAELQERLAAVGYTGYRPSEQGVERRLYFLTDQGTPKYGHRIEDSSRRVLYEAKMTKYAVTRPFGFDFIDHEHGTTTPHLVGHEEESQWDTFLIDDHRTFELDGVDVWRHLKDNGVSVETSYGSGSGPAVGMRLRILRDGVEIARAESTSVYPHEEDAEAHKILAAVPARGFYRIRTREEYLDVVFVTLMAFARSGAGDDEGGNYGALRGTLKNLKQ